MPFVTRKVEPRYLCRGHVKQGEATRNWPVGAELEAAANGALTASLKQLASLLVAAEDIFAELTGELAGIADRSGRLRARIDRVEEKLAQQDPKKIPVRKSCSSLFCISVTDVDIYYICSFSRKRNYSRADYLRRVER
ncbi:hypothetical protein TKK_0007200 [Trichogramma kaykai]|uniref:Wiskott-Aldrich syndrome protein family member 3 n=1 Tax=Trichogramma kaykai TaxID=54128 RepID=A0ABD2X8K3_9HYME